MVEVEWFVGALRLPDDPLIAPEGVVNLGEAGVRERLADRGLEINCLGYNRGTPRR